MLKNYVQMFNSIGSTSSRLEKERLLREYQNDEGFLEILKFCYNPQISTGLARRKIEKTVETPLYTPIESIFEAMQFVADNNTGSDNVICSVQHFIRNLETEDERKLATSILISDMPYGISKTTLNKIYGSDFIKEYSVQLAGRYDPENPQFEGPFSLSLKLDGNRATVFTTKNGVVIKSRSGKIIDGLVDLEKEFSKMPKGLTFDGELIAENPDNLSSKDLFRVSQTIIRSKGIKRNLNFVAFDILPTVEFEVGMSKEVYAARMANLQKLYLEYADKNSLIKIVPIFYTGSDHSVIPKLLDEVTSKGYEGLMMNNLNAKYQTKRTKDLLKIKMFHSVDLRCIGVNEDIRGGRCGSLCVLYKGFKVNVAGLTDKDKVEFWNHPEKVVGKIIEVKYFEESQNASDGISLRFPNFIQIREEKNEVSYN